MDNSNFHTLKGYEIMEEKSITYAMEDYLEMICRICNDAEYTRITDVAKNLNVKPSSVTKMATTLKSEGLIEFEKYGSIKPTLLGKHLGDYLVFRHNTIHNLLCFINQSTNELEQVEKIEHYLNQKTVLNIENFLKSTNSEK